MRFRSRLLAIVLGCGLAHAGGVWLNVPFVRQAKNGCGSASVAMVMQYWQSQGVSVSAAQTDAASIQQTLYSAEARGIRASALERYLDENGFRALVFRGEWSDLNEHLAKGRPLIVGLGAGLLHYVVVVGLDGPAVMVNDPADRKLRKLDRAGFERRWRTAGNWTLLALPRVDAGS